MGVGVGCFLLLFSTDILPSRDAFVLRSTNGVNAL